MGGDRAKASAGPKWFTFDGRQPLITKSPRQMSMEAAARRAAVKPAKPLTARQALANRKAEAALRDQMPPIGPSSFTHYLRFGG